MSKLEDNYGQVLTQVRQSEDGLYFRELGQGLFLDSFIVYGCIRRGIKEGRLLTSLDGKVRYNFVSEKS